jgi:hypothetical protein
VWGGDGGVWLVLLVGAMHFDFAGDAKSFAFSVIFCRWGVTTVTSLTFRVLLNKFRELT